MNIIKSIRNKVGKKLLHDSLMIEGFVTIKNGNTNIKFKNSMVDQGLIGIINIMSYQSASTTDFSPSYNFAAVSTQSFIALGSDTATPTTHSTTALTTPIGAPTKANTQSGTTSNPSAGQYQLQWNAIWNAGTFGPGVTLGEVGLFLNIIKALSPNVTVGGTGRSDAGGVNTITATKVMAPHTESIVTLLTYIPAPAGNSRAAIYTDSSGTPLTLLNESGSQLSVTGFNSYTIPSTALTFGTTYWIAINQDSGFNLAALAGAPGTNTRAFKNWAYGAFQATLTGITEDGIVPYMGYISTLSAFGATSPGATPGALFSRSASKDGKFVSFIIDDTAPLAVTWTLLMTYTT